MKEFAAYFDDSGHPDDQPYVIVAGYVSAEDQWLRFEKEWNDTLATFPIDEPFHATDFEKFSLWNRERKDRYLDKLIGRINTRAQKGFVCAIPMDVYHKINDIYALEECIGTPYSIAASTIMGNLREWREKYVKPEDKLLYYFEKGTKHQGDFEDAMKRDEFPEPQFAPKSLPPLQAADLLAWEAFNACKKSSIRPSLRKLISLPNKDGYWDESDFLRSCKLMNVPLRSDMPEGFTFVYHNQLNRERRRTLFRKPKK